MLNHIRISGFKCLEQSELPLNHLTVLAGPNSSGKSTLIQAMLLALSGLPHKNQPYLKEVIKPFAQLEDTFCRFSNAHEIRIELGSPDGDYLFCLDQSGMKTKPSTDVSFPVYEESMFYLSAGRSGPEETSELNREVKIGQYGQFALGYLEQRKDKPVHQDLVHPEADSKTLKAQLAWWLSFIIGEQTEARTEKITSTRVKTTFQTAAIDNISPLNTGAGSSFLLKLLVMCLTAKPGDLLLLENPEIHLHPGAQSRIGSLLAFIAGRGVQVVAETHCEHLINRIRYEVYADKISTSRVIIHYKPGVRLPFETLYINAHGHFSDDQGMEKVFPAGFFDSTLAELLEIS